MARPIKKTVEYFPHYIGDGKKIFYIEQKYGNDGYAIWFKILETLAATDDHYINLNAEMDILFLSAKCRVTKERLLEVINDLCQLGEIDQFLWLNKIVYSHRFIESVQDAYERRSNKCIHYEDLCTQLSHLCTTITKLMYEKQYRNTQTKLNYIKLNETKGEETKGDVPPVGNLHKHFELAKSEYIEIYSLNFSAPPTFGKFCNKDLNSICYRVQENMINRGISVTADMFKQTIKGIFVMALADKWLKANYTPSNIEKRIDQIINNAKKQYEQHNYVPSWDRD